MCYDGPMTRPRRSACARRRAAEKNVYDRLYIGSKTQASLGMRTPQGRLEMAGDIAFKNGDSANAVPLYTKAIAQQPDLFKYEKRCAAYAEVGQYRDALNDANYILVRRAHGGTHAAAHDAVMCDAYPTHARQSLRARRMTTTTTTTTHG